MQRPQPAKVGKGLGPFKVQRRERQLKRYEGADQKACDPPKGGCDHASANHAVAVFIGRGRSERHLVGLTQYPQKQISGDKHDQKGMYLIC